MTKIMCHYGSDLETEDVIGRNALYFALKINNLDIIKILFIYGARPWSNKYFPIVH